MDIYEHCPVMETPNFLLRLIRPEDSESLFGCYHDKTAVALMNADNCDFGFYMETREQMAETVTYWLKFYSWRSFVRFAIVDRETGQAVGTLEGFGGDVGVLRIDIAGKYEKADYLSELLGLAKKHFREWFGNETLMTKAVPQARERREALMASGWEFVDTFRTYRDYYQCRL